MSEFQIGDIVDGARIEDGCYGVYLGVRDGRLVLVKNGQVSDYSPSTVVEKFESAMRHPSRRGKRLRDQG